MVGQELKLFFRKDRAYLVADCPLKFHQLGLPSYAQECKDFAFWKIKVLNYKESEKRLFCEIISYHVGEAEFETSPSILADELRNIQIISFKSIDTAGLLKTLAGKSGVFEPTKYSEVERTPVEEVESIKPIRKVVIKETFDVHLKNVRFKLGGVSFERKFDEHKTIIEITIPNYDIREEFDAIKNYFANVLKTKKIQVRVIIEIIEGVITSIEAKSAEIDRINKQLIDQVKFEFVKSTTKKKLSVDIDKSLFTMDEYFNTFSDQKFKSNTFYTDDKQLFDDLLSISSTKHYKQLRFLSSMHAHEIMKLRFVHKPFSFIFLIKGDRNFHIVWETLDTEEATYIWHIAKDINILKMTLRKIEDIINVIKVQGKTAYLNSTEDQFRRIYHDYSDLVDGFVKWKGELESMLT